MSDDWDDRTRVEAEEMRGWIAAETIVGNLKPEDGARRLTAVNKAVALGEPIPDIRKDGWANLTGHSKPADFPQSFGDADWTLQAKPMTIEDARLLVRERLGIAWQLRTVKSTLRAGPFVGAPTAMVVDVVLDYHPGMRSEQDPGYGSVGVTGPHLTFEGTGSSIRDALMIAFGAGLDHDSVKRYGNAAEHTWER